MQKQGVAEVLAELCRSSPDIQGCALVAEHGEVVASSLKPGMDPARLGSVSVAALKLGEAAAGGLGCGALEQLTLKGKDGYILFVPDGKKAVLGVMAASSAKVGLILQDVRRAMANIAEAH